MPTLCKDSFRKLKVIFLAVTVFNQNGGFLRRARSLCLDQVSRAKPIAANIPFQIQTRI